MKEGRIIKVNEDVILVGFQEGENVNIERKTLSFTPAMGLCVEVYEDGDAYIVLPKAGSEPLGEQEAKTEEEREPLYPQFTSELGKIEGTTLKDVTVRLRRQSISVPREFFTFVPYVGTTILLSCDGFRYEIEKSEDTFKPEGSFTQARASKEPIDVRIVHPGHGGSDSEHVYSSKDGNVVNKIAYCLLCFFLGGIGAHKFYSGRIGLGVLYLIFCWTFIPTIVAFIEFLVALCKPSDQYGNICL